MVVHFLLDRISTIDQWEPTIRIEDQLLDATLFTTLHKGIVEIC
jgi:hypothetical protein